VLYDNVDRAIGQETGADVGALLAPDGTSVVALAYAMRGSLQAIGSSYGPLVSNQVFAADGKPESATLGDLAGTSATWEYDGYRRNTRYAVARLAPAQWIGSPSYPAPPSDTTQRHLIDLGFEYSSAEGDLPVWVRDNSPPGEWPTTMRPVHRQFAYDDLYRVTNVNYTYQGGTGFQTMPLAAEIAAGDAAPAPSRNTNRRVLTQSYAYDWQGNTKQTEDDQGQRYDRSLGVIEHHPARPNQLLSASGVAAVHDVAGNLVDLRVERPGTCMVGGTSKCSQRYAYEYDEVGQLTRARRWDYAGSTIPATEPSYPDTPVSVPDAELRYAYHMDQRVLKSATVSGSERHTVEVFDSLRLNRAAYDELTNDYERTVDTEAIYLGGVARLAYAPGLPTLEGKSLHVFFEVGDHLGSASVVIDAETSELVERTTFQPHGAAEADYRPARWGSFREDYKFTGKEEDIEVGLTYFGGRYLHPRLGRWTSADPLTIHGLGADLNPYAYVHGRLSTAVDPWGLDENSDKADGGKDYKDHGAHGYTVKNADGTFEAKDHDAPAGAAASAPSAHDRVERVIGALDRVAEGARQSPIPNQRILGEGIRDLHLAAQAARKPDVDAALEGARAGLALGALDAALPRIPGVTPLIEARVQGATAGNTDPATQKDPSYVFAMNRARAAVPAVVAAASGAAGAARAAVKPKGNIPKPPRGAGSVPQAKRDPKRFFGDRARATQREAQEGKCAVCGTEIDGSNSEGHHVQRHADGGQTSPSNHVEVCADCHRELHKKP
jgi:RHS repeat-associated protein